MMAAPGPCGSLFALVLAALAGCATAPAAVSTPATPPTVAVTGEPADGVRQWEADIAALQARDRALPPAPGSVVFVGSSSIRLWDTLATDFPGVATSNRGFGGSRVRDLLHYADRLVLPLRPRAVVVYAGDNDLSEGLTPQQVHDDFVALVARIHAAQPGTPVAFIAIKPSPSRAALLPQVRAANALVRRYARTSRHVDYLDVFMPMLDREGRPRAELFLADQLHLNAGGYRVWTQVVGPWLRALPSG